MQHKYTNWSDLRISGKYQYAGSGDTSCLFVCNRIVFTRLRVWHMSSQNLCYSKFNKENVQVVTSPPIPSSPRRY
jgi:hypothetical protein